MNTAPVRVVIVAADVATASAKLRANFGFAEERDEDDFIFVIHRGAIGDAIVLQGLFQRSGELWVGVDEVLQAGVVGKQCAEEGFEVHGFSGVG